MGCCNQPSTALTGLPADPTQHVNFERGMVLGVDDFRQEFAYLSGHDHWFARDVAGYGTLSGLRVFVEADGSEGPRVHVAPGSALLPSGRMVCVPSAQCATLNRWLAKPENALLVAQLLNPVSPPISPPASPSLPPAVTTGTIALHLVLCHHECATRPVPIPGEPCRSEDELMKPSRIADDYRLALRAPPPMQEEEDALRDFVRWLRGSVQLVELSPPPANPAEAWLTALRGAVQPWRDALEASPPLSPPPAFGTLGDYLVDLGSPGLSVDRDRQCEFLRVAFGFWITELRPLWQALRCHRAQHPDTDCVLLAEVNFDVVWVGGSPEGAWQVDGSPATVRIDERRRPLLAHQRLLQEWMLCGCDCSGGDADFGAGAPLPAPPIANEELVAPPAPGPGPGPAPGPAPAPEPAPEPAPAPGPGDFGGGFAPLLLSSESLNLDQSHSIVFAQAPERVLPGPSAVTFTLPAPRAALAGRTYTVKNISADLLTLAIAGRTARRGPTIDGLAQLELSRGQGVTVVADGVGGWHTIARL